MLASMELRHLRYFAAAAEEQNVTRAAARLHVSQPSLSRQILDLECELGFALFDHGPKAIRLTDAGHDFHGEVREILSRIDQAVQLAKAAATGQHGEIHVGYAPSLTVELLPHALRVFQTANPGLRVQLHDLSTEEMLRGLRDGKLHAALMIGTPARVRTGLIFEELRRYAVCVAVPRAHPLARNRQVGLQHLAAEPLIAYTLADYPEYRAWLSSLLAPLQRPPRIAEEHDSATSLIASVEAGRGIALVQEGFEHLAGRRLKILPLTPAPPPFVVGLAYRKETTSTATGHFVTAVRKATLARHC
jgi:DNA-binding transcriptional LysR family regulator